MERRHRSRLSNAKLALSHSVRRAATRTSLQRAVAVLRARQESAIDGILVVDRQGQVLSYNQRFLEIWGIPPEVAATCDDRQLLRHAIASIAEPEAFLQEVEHLYAHPEEERTGQTVSLKEGRVLSRSTIPLIDRGAITGRVWYFRDMTERVRDDALKSALFRIGQLSRDSADLDHFYGEVHTVIGTLMDATNFYIAEYDAVHDILTFPYFVDAFDPPPEGKPAGRGLTAYVLRSGKPLLTNAALFRELIESGEVMQIGATFVQWLGAPLKSGDRTWGIIGIQTYEESGTRYTERERDILLFVAQHVATAIEHKRAEEELHARAAQQSAVAALLHHTLSAVSETTFDLCCSLMQDTLGLEFAAFLQFLPARQNFVLGGGRHPASEASWDDRSQAAHSFRDDDALSVADYSSETRFDVTCFTAAGIRSGLSLPVSSGLSRFGVIEAGRRDRHPFSQTEVQFGQAMAHVLAEAMERERAKQALVESEARYREVVEGASEIIYTISAEGLITSLNPAFEAISGWPVEDWLGRAFVDLIPEEQQQRARHSWGLVLREKRAGTADVHLLARDGHQIHVEATSFPKLENGTIREVYGFARDVTQARRAEEERERASRELERLLESTAEGIYTIDCTGRCTRVNRAAKLLLGYESELWIGRNVHDLLHPTRPDGSPYPRLGCPIHGAQTGPVSAVDEIFRRQDGSSVAVACTASEIHDAGVLEGYVVTFHDVTEYRQMQSQVEQAKRLTSLGRLSATIAHEFNNVLMGISPFVDLLRRETLSPRGVMAVDQMQKSVERGKGVTGQILRFTQSAAPVLEAIDSCAWLQAVANEAERVTGPGYVIRTECPDAPPLFGDPHQLHQSMMNLVINARDAMPAGGIITLSAKRGTPGGDYPFGPVPDAGTSVHLAVRDNGQGIEPSVLSHIFEPLFTTKKNGTGLGLAVTHQVVTRHKGNVFVESQLGKGTAFHLFIPVSAEDRKPVPARVYASRTRFHDVLLVEDDSVVSLGLSTLLRDEGLRVDVVETGAAALASLERRRPDLVVLDIGLPDMQGSAVYEIIAQRYPSLPVLFSTGHGDRADVEIHLAQRHHTGFLRKPYDADTFFEALEDLEPAS